MTDSEYILRCVELAKNGQYYVAPNPMVGAVLVEKSDVRSQMSDEKIFAEGWHHKYGEAHAEVECFRQAEKKMAGLTEAEKAAKYKTMTLYVSLEPCSHYGKTPPCADLIVSKGVKRVVVGCLDPNPQVAGRGVQKLLDAGIEVTVGVEQQACRDLNKRFLCLHEKHRPYVILKWAQTADGFVDREREVRNQKSEIRNQKSEDSEPLVISTAVTKQLVHKMRAENMAIMVGTNTVLLDNPRLLNTHWEGRSPIRVTLDRHHVIPADARIFSGDAETIVYRDRTDWPFVLSDLAARNIHSILVEGGPALLAHILQTKLWDEIHIEVAPELRIGDGVPAPQIPLPTAYETADGHCLYTIYNNELCEK